MVQSISPESGCPAGDPHLGFGGERGRIELDAPVGAGLMWELDDGVLHVEFHGEICAWSVERLQPMLLSLLGDVQPWAIAMRLSKVTFFDASGVNLLVRARRLAADRGAKLSVESTSRFVRRVLALCELDGEFGVS
jgi:anti-anti-sigma factor